VIVTQPLVSLLQIAFPIVVAIWFIRRYRVSWWVVFAGAAAFLLSQVLHIPFNSAVQPLVASSVPQSLRVISISIFLGLSAGLFEETARAVCYALLKNRARFWQGGVALGIGHGGAESAIFVGLAGLITFINLLVIRGNPQLVQGNAEAQIQVNAFWATAGYLPFVGLAERLMTFVIQIGMSLLVLQAFLRHNAVWYVAAVVWHALIDASAAYIGQSGGSIFVIEGLVLVFALISAWFIWKLKPRALTAATSDQNVSRV
jgi:uncharacterized membrane protein YhfC